MDTKTIKAMSTKSINPQIYGDIKPLTESDRVAILEAEKHERSKFEKRLNSYLKRYGVSKLHTWTYWRDA